MFDQAGAATETNHPPAGDRPLLRDHESGYLDNFFNDPNTVDATSLFAMSMEGQNDSANAFSNTALDWLQQPGGDFDDTSAHTVPQAEQNDWQTQSLGAQSANDGSRQMQTSADVYQAAGILHNNTNNLNRQQNANAYPYVASNSAADPNGYTYPPLNASSGANYYNSPSASGNPYSGFPQDRYAQAEAVSPYGQAYSDSQSQGRRNNPLNFGSDDNFRRSMYEAASMDGPDKELADAITHNFVQGGNIGAGPFAPVANMRKRARASDEHDVKDEDGSDDGDGVDSKKRRTVKSQDEDDGGYDNRPYGRGKKAKRRPQPAREPSTQDVPSTPSQQEQSSSRLPGSRPARENLSEEQKRNNHIQSEQKRRNLIKEGYDQITKMVPELRSGNQSKSNLLIEAGKFIRKMRDDNAALEALVGPIDKG